MPADSVESPCVVRDCDSTEVCCDTDHEPMCPMHCAEYRHGPGPFVWEGKEVAGGVYERCD